MKARTAFLHVALALNLTLSGGLLQGAEQDMRQASFGAFTIITDAKEKEVAAWVAEFDGFRHVVQDLMGIKDEQLLPLTIVLLAKQEDVRELLPAVQRAGSDVLLLTVGLGQQPMIATAVERRSADTAVRVRTGTVMWLLSSAGINYDPWIVQGCIDLFGNLQIKQGEVRSTRLIESHMKQLNRASKYAAPRALDLNRIPSEPVYAWVALHYLLIGREGWKGTSALTMYQRTVAGGWGREEAFTAAFALPLPEANDLINEYLKRGRVSEVRLAAAPNQPAPNLQLRPLTPGMRDCLFAQFMVQWTGYDKERVLERINRAAALMPDDVKMHETWWFYYMSNQEPGQARESLTKAVRAGTRNHYLRLQWCIDQINDRILSYQGFLCESEIAMAAADTLADVIRINPHSMSAYKMLAQFVASIVPARESDRKLLEAGRAAMPGNLLINIGLAAWEWRHGNLDQAKAQLASISVVDSAGPIAPAYAAWLEVQLQASATLKSVQAAVAANDYATADQLLVDFGARPLSNPQLQRAMDAVRAEVDYNDILLRAEKNWAGGRHDTAEALLQSVLHGEISPALRTRAEKLREKFAQKSTG